MDFDELSTQLIAFARWEEHGAKRNLMRSAAHALESVGGDLSPDAVLEYLEARGITLLKWQTDRLYGSMDK